jgi:arabinose-5-phosphate isomerase
MTRAHHTIGHGTWAAREPEELKLARHVLRTEGEAVLALIDQVDENLTAAVHMLLACQGRVIATGMGKSGLVCRKIAATLSSTGTPAFFLHPAEAIHGDFGVIQHTDVVLALSHSGETVEILRLLTTIKRIGARLIAITGSPASTLAQQADATISCRVKREACPMNLAPTASTTAALALGDALAMVLVAKKGFGHQDFVKLHPGGQLGRRLVRVESLMHAGDEIPAVTATAPMRDVISEMSIKGMGMTCVVDGQGTLAGVITDGDLRRQMVKRPDLLECNAAELMTCDPATIGRSMLAVQALQVMEERKITSLPVVDSCRRLEGVLHLHDLWRTQMF